jgi:DNA-binding response OmpR family regulator
MTLAIDIPCDPALLPVDQMDPPVALVVEDDPDTRARICAILVGDGWRVFQAPDGERGLMLAREHVPDVMLLDLALPRMSGLDVLHELRSPQWADQPTAVVVVSAFANLMRLPDLRLADATVQKPFAADELLAQVAAARVRHRRSVFG